MAARKKANTISSGKIRDTFELSLLALPGVLLFFIFNYLPMFGIIIAFKRFNPNLGILGSPWVGFQNFEFFFTSQTVFRVMRNTVGYSLLFLVLDVLAGVTLAVMFYILSSRKALKVYNTIVILPRFMSMVIIAFIVHSLFSPSFGIVNGIRGVFGNRPIQWYSNPIYWPFILTITHVWRGVGMNCIIYYAALMGLDGEQLEAAELDGASRWQKIKYIMVPHLTSVIIILTILGIGRIFTGDFGLFYQVPQGLGILLPATDIINTYVFRALITGGMERSAAVGLFQSFSGLVLVLLTNLIVRKISPENSLF